MNLFSLRNVLINLGESMMGLKSSDSHVDTNMEYARKMKSKFNFDYFTLSGILLNMKADKEQKELDDFDPIDYI